VHDSRLHDGVVEGGAAITDSILVAEGEPASHRCDSAGRRIVRGADCPRLGGGAKVSGCTLVNCSVGSHSHVTDTYAHESRLGDFNTISDTKLELINTDHHVTITGPTEVSEAWVGHHTTIDQRGYYEGVFSNTFMKLRFNETSGKLEVLETIDLPHVSRYGLNTVNSTNSGKLLPRRGGVLRTLGPLEGLWVDRLLSHEQVELAPCCWVAPWTKVIGQSNSPHLTDEELVNDELTTYISPFAVAGWGGDLTRGLVAPGELSVGLGPKEKIGGWVFTYAPDAVMSMVQRLHEALPSDRKSIADGIVTEALRSGLEMAKAAAARRNVDLELPLDRQRPGWARRIATDHALLKAHLEGKLWEFEGGQPKGWYKGNGKWTHPNVAAILRVAPDALEEQVTEEQILRCDDPVPATKVVLPSGKLPGAGSSPQIHPTATIHPKALIGPGCRIGPQTRVSEGAVVWNSVLSGDEIGPGARIERSVLSASNVGRDAIVRSCVVTGSNLGQHSSADSAAISKSRLAENTIVSPFADLDEVTAQFSTILGGIVHKTEIETYLMSMHMAGACSHLKAIPSPVYLGGRKILVPGVPMLGGGCLIRGQGGEPVVMECCFIGSNAVIERGTYIGFGCFVLGILSPRSGLPPFTISTAGTRARDQIGGVLGMLASTAITHFINWTYQAAGPQLAPAVAELVPQAIRRGIGAVEDELASRRESPSSPRKETHPYRSLQDYSQEQLEAGLRNYRRALDSGAWEMRWTDGELVFSSDKGNWSERNGSVMWKKR